MQLGNSDKATACPPTYISQEPLPDPSSNPVYDMTAAPDEGPSKKRGTLLISVMALVIVAALLGGVYYMYNQSVEGSSQSDSDAIEVDVLVPAKEESKADPFNYFNLNPHKLPPAGHDGLREAPFLYETIPVKTSGSNNTGMVNFCFESLTEDRYSDWMNFLETLQKSAEISSADKETLTGMIKDLVRYREEDDDSDDDPDDDHFDSDRQEIHHTRFAYTTVSPIKSHDDLPELEPQYIESFMMVLGARNFQIKIHSPVLKCPQYLNTVAEGRAKLHDDIPKLLNGWASKATLIVDPAARLTVLPKYDWIPSVPMGDKVTDRIVHSSGFWSSSYKFFPFLKPDDPQIRDSFIPFSRSDFVVASYKESSGRKAVKELDGVYRKKFVNRPARLFNWLFTFDLDQMKGADPFAMASLYDPKYDYVEVEYPQVDGFHLNEIFYVGRAKWYLLKSCQPRRKLHKYVPNQT